MIRHLRLLAWLRWKYLWRAGGRSRKVGTALSFIMSFFIAGVLFLVSSTALARVFNDQDPRVAWEMVHLAFAVIYFFWLYSGSFNDLYDPGRLAPYPLSPRLLFVGSTLSSFIGLTPIFGFALLAGFATGISGSTGEGFVRGLLFLFLLIHLQMTARLIRLTFLALLTSRRWRDASVLISSMIGGGLYLMWQILPRELGAQFRNTLYGFAETGGPSRWLSWCPAVWLSWTYELAGLRSLAGFGAFAIVTGLIAWAGGAAERRLALSDPIFQYRPRRAAPVERVPFLRGITRAMLGAAGPVAAAVARKEFAVFFRDPAVRHRVLASVFYILVPFTVLFVLRAREKAPALELGSFFLIFAEMFFLTNLFGIEGSAVRNLLWFPASRRQIFLGKNLAYLVLFGPFNTVVLTVIGLATDSGLRIPTAIASHLSALLVVMALGNVTSVFFPLPFLAPGQRMTRRDESGCLMMIARSLLYLLTFFLLGPVLVLTLLLEDSSWRFAAGAAGLAYAVLIYVIGLKISERALLRREEALGDYFRAA